MAKRKPTKPTLKKRARKKPATKKAAPASKLNTSWHARFLEILGSTCNVTLAAKGAGIDRTSAYDHYKTLPDFAAAWDDAKESAIEILEAEAWQRARKQSDTLMIFLLKAHKPDKYREIIKQEHSGPNGGPIEHKHKAFQEAASLIYGNGEGDNAG